MNYQIVRLTGRCADGAERDGGRLTHAIPEGAGRFSARALCGAKPGKRSNGWSEPFDKSDAPSCARCNEKIARKKLT
jgi:hypothetical protein